MGNSKSLNSQQPTPGHSKHDSSSYRSPTNFPHFQKTSIQQPQQTIHSTFNNIISPHPPKKYKAPNQAPFKKQQSDNSDENDLFDELYPEETKSHVELDSQQYAKSHFLDKEYLKALPIIKKGNKIRIDDSKTMFFKAGYCPVYSDSIYVFSDLNEESLESTWADLEEPEYTETRTLSYASDLGPFSFDKENRKYLMQAGWVVIIKNKWGFLLNLDSVAEAYDGHLHARWKALLQQSFFQDIFSKFGEYIADLHEQGNVNAKKYHVFKQLPTTDFDPAIPKGYLPEPLHDQLFLHQKQEVGWMFSLENYPALKVVAKDKYIRFLDTGYYIDPQDLSGFVKVKSNNEKIDIIVPGGILASQIGSGKTVTTIALISIGTQFSGCSEPVEEEFKGNDPTKKAQEELNYLLDGVYEPSLIIVTQNILGQWAEEFRKFAPNLRVAMVETVADLIGLQFGKEGKKTRLINYDVILTHRKIIEEGESLLEKYCPEIFQVTFRRIMMDEFHELTTYFIQQATYLGYNKEAKESIKKLDMLKFYKTLNRIDRRFTWGITGTPDSLNYYAEINPLFKLLGLGAQYDEFRRAFKNNDEFIMTCMRKNPRSVDLPELKKSIRRVMFGQLQNILYKGKLHYGRSKQEAQEICSHMLKQWRHIATDSEDYLQIAIENIRLKHKDEILAMKRLMERHPNEQRWEIRLRILNGEGNFFDEVINLLSQKTFECPICFDECDANKIVITECLHNLCVTCYEQLRKNVYHLQCPVCREHVSANGLVIHPKFVENKENKLTAILQAIEETPTADKIIIFTQFHSLVEHLSEIFNKVGIQYMVLRGEPTEINMSLAKFKINPEMKILLMSVEQAASGINVQEANHVFFAHPIFGMEFEKAAITYNQCIGRAYRIGQMKRVEVQLFVTADSLEVDLVPSFSKYGDPLK